MASRPTLRAAREADLPALVGLIGLLFRIEADFQADPRRQRRGLRLMLREPGRRAVIVAEQDGAVVGMVTVQLVVSTAEGGASAWLEDLVVDAPARGRGVGRRLLRAAERWARDRAARRLQLLADVENAPALGFYRRMGWGGTRLACLRRGGAPGRSRAAGGRVSRWG